MAPPSSEREHLFFPGRPLRAARPCCLKNYFLFAGGCAFDAKYDSTNGLARSYVCKNTNQPAMTIAAHLSREDMRNSFSRATTWPKPLGIYHDECTSSTTKLISRFGTYTDFRIDFPSSHFETFFSASSRTLVSLTPMSARI